jgi:hypothetical protein
MKKDRNETRNEIMIPPPWLGGGKRNYLLHQHKFFGLSKVTCINSVEINTAG